MLDENKDTLPEEAQIVREYLDASMKPDPDLAATYVADDVTITFTGGTGIQPSVRSDRL